MRTTKAAKFSVRRALLLHSSLLGLTMSSPLMAQAAPTANEGATEGDIVVTARRREESLSDVPLAITAITGEQLNGAGAQNLRDIAQLTPGLIVIDAGAQFYTTPTIRGLAQLNIQNGAIENNVSVFLNGVYLQNAGAINVSLLNLERVEVVKGPVSALYGRSAFAGAINYVTRKASDTLTATFSGTVGTSERYTVSGSISGPLANGLRATIGGTYDSFGGTWKDPVNANPAGGFTKRDFFVGLDADLGPDTRLSVNGYYGKDRFDPPSEYHLTNNCAVIGGVAQQYCGRIPEGTVVEVPQAYQSGASGNDREVKHVDATLATKIGEYATTLIAGYNNLATRQFLEINNRRDGLTYGLVPGPGTINLNEYYGDNNRSEDYSLEGRIASPQYSAFRFSVGAFYYHSDGAQQSNISLNRSLLPAGQTGINSFLANLWLTPGAVPSSLRNFAVTSGDQYSAFAEGELKITPTLSFAQELRYTSETKNIQVISSALSATATFAPLTRTYNYWNSRSTLRFKPNGDIMVYASAANGTKSGGFNGRATLPIDAAYDPEKNWTYELGVKGSLFDRRFTYEAAIYHIDATNLQILGLNSDPANPGQVVKNFGNANNTGFEIQTRTRLARDIAFNLGFAYNDPRFGNGSVDAQYAGICAAIASCAPQLVNGSLPGTKVINIAGNALPRQSKYQITSSLDAAVPLQNDWKLTGLVKYAYQSSQFYETANFSSFGPTHNLGLRFGVAKGGLSATVYVENLLNQTEAYSAFYNIRINDFVFETLPIYNDKRTAGITVSTVTERTAAMLVFIGRASLAFAALAAIGACSADQAVRPRVAPATDAGRHFRDFADAPEMVVVPAGRFVMGSPLTELGRDPDEGPQREIVIARPFAVSKLVVTRGQYAAFVRATHRPDGPDCYADRGHSGSWKFENGLTWHDPGFKQTARDPAVCINMDDVRAYISWLNARSGGGYRLLSEAEYEYAARAGATTRFPWGDMIDHSLGNLGGDPCCGGKVQGPDRWMYTSPGGAFGTNRFGLSDMQGNVWEFVADCYTPTLAVVPTDGGPVTTNPCEKNVIRGAGWDDPPNYLRSANRYKQLPTIRGSVTGFRLARTLG